MIPSVTEPFCDSCNRMRLTAEGQFRNCLFALDETDLRGPMREGADDAELEALMRDAMWRKWSGHRIDHAGLPAAGAQHVDDRRLGRARADPRNAERGRPRPPSHRSRRVPYSAGSTAKWSSAAMPPNSSNE